MSRWVFFAVDPQSPLPLETGGYARSMLAVAIVLGLLFLLAWLLRRGTLGPMRSPGRAAVKVETAVPLGERRTLVVVAVEGRRLLLGLTPAQVSLVAELNPTPPFEQTLAQQVEGPGGRA